MRVHSSLLALAVFLFAAIAVHAQDTSVADCNKVKELPTYKTCFAAKEKAGAPSGVSITCAGARAQFECIGAEGQSAVDKCCKAGTAMLNSYDQQLYWHNRDILQSRCCCCCDRPSGQFINRVLQGIHRRLEGRIRLHVPLDV